ncbi:ATP-binding protein [Desulforhopalus sp. IMCC35007]|uniref:ATP-binding protein n=1 Tax=Desulforhopalus sp. IMCC35007 TaxID=2569543 RepID=UPI0010AE1A1D|nr:ATP-binding protein [Desulforhopalus sp. IMCC35007]TKB08167.1 4Fe-4S dicluster domain-containing protein [Desulforhopalus sp. IMCC35007]
MIISIASGKGGTGKTTVATNLALSLNGDVNLLDCDVEEPNAHLFIKPTMDKVEPVTTFIPVIDSEKCNLCRKCTDICRFSALAVAGKTVLVFPEMCHSCEGCIEVCPEGAISASTRELGVLESGHSGNLGFYLGRMRVGEAMSPPLIKKVRTKERERDITIIDAPPGTSCPVIAAMKGTDFVLMVTEPTPFGLHDLKLAVEAVKVLGIPSGLVINRADMGNSGVKDYAAEENIPVLMEIPFDRKIAEAYSRGIPIVEAFPDYADKFRALYAKIEKYSSVEKES